jgi:hypothetical protein
MGDVRTDYMPLDEFRHRAIQAIRRGDQSLPAKVIDIKVRFTESFDAFVHDVAYALRQRWRSFRARIRPRQRRSRRSARATAQERGQAG